MARTSQQLRRIAEQATALADERGDTEWSPEQRERITEALRALDAVGPIVRRYSTEVVS